MSTITQANAEDIQEVLDFLERCHLPQDGVHACLSTLVVAREAGRVIGCSALEVYESVALLHSVAVDPASRSRSLGASVSSGTSVSSTQAWHPGNLFAHGNSS